MKTKPLEHAEHNETVCAYLDIGEAHNRHDWVVTTAFYSALHFARHKIFPITIEAAPKKEIEFETFEDYYHYHSSINPRCGNKHEFLKKLVRQKINSVADDYDHLLGMSQNARYDNYNLDENFSKSAKKSLKKIKAACKAL